MEDLREYRPAMNPAFVQRVHEKRRREDEKRLADQHQAKLERAILRKKEKEAEIRRLNAKIKKAKEELDFTRGLITAKEIIEIVASKHNLPALALVGFAREKHISEARFEAIAEVKRLRPDMSSAHIGRIFGGRDHSTILAALKKANARKEAA